jgi:hypothetical protein
MDTIRPALDRDLICKILEIKPKYITTPAFLNLLLEQAYDSYKENCKNQKNMTLYIYKDKELDKKGLERKEQKEKINKKEKQEKIVPEDLKHIELLILEFWKGKKGAKSIEAWKRQITEYRKFIQKYGDEVLKEQLDAGILAGTWSGCTIKNYEEQQQRRNRFNKEPEKEIKHPAQKVVQFDEMGRII